jgi:hypothetical protein
MKRLLIVIVALLLLAVALPAAAVPVEAHGNLAGYFPDDTSFFMSARTDDAFIETLDGLLARVYDVFPVPGAAFLGETLDEMTAQVKPGATFAEYFRPWFGDFAAAGLLSFDMSGEMMEEPTFLLAIQITDREAAEAYFNEVTTPRTYRQTVEDEYTLYEARRADDPTFVFREDVILVSNDESAIAEGGVPEAPLSNLEAFDMALSRLPETDYNAVLYYDYAALLSGIFSNPDMMEMLMESGDEMMQAQMQMFMGMMDAVEPFAIGFTILDERSLTMDAALSTAGLTEAFAGANVPATMSLPPVDLAFARHIPAGTPLVIMGTELRLTYDVLLEALRGIAAMQTDEDSTAVQDVELALWMVEFGIRGLTGLELREDILEWMGGTYALYVGLTPTAQDTRNMRDLVSELPVDFALAVEATDSAGAAALRENLNRVLGALPDNPGDNITVSIEQIGGVDAVVFTWETFNMPPKLEFVFAANDEVFVVGTRRYVEAALDPQNGLDTDPAFIEANQYLLPNTSAVYYLSGADLAPLADIAALAPGSDLDGALFLEGLFDLVSSGTISQSVDEDGVSIGRAVLTLAE